MFDAVGSVVFSAGLLFFLGGGGASSSQESEEDEDGTGLLLFFGVEVFDALVPPLFFLAGAGSFYVYTLFSEDLSSDESGCCLCASSLWQQEVACYCTCSRCRGWSPDQSPGSSLAWIYEQ